MLLGNTQENSVEKPSKSAYLALESGAWGHGVAVAVRRLAVVAVRRRVVLAGVGRVRIVDGAALRQTLQVALDA